VIFGIGVLYKISNDRDFGENRLSTIHTLFGDGNEFPPVISICIDRSG
jgi:hypothetical protein